MNSSIENAQKNEIHYDKVYSKVSVQPILNKLSNLDEFLADATVTDTSWVGMYYGNFQHELKGKKVLELGCGDCTNAAVMAALGAEVYANDISQESGRIIQELNSNWKFVHPLRFVEGNFLKAKLPLNYFDIVVGKAFVHHLTHKQEHAFLKVIVNILNEEGQVRYFEPAVNSKILDVLRWHTPVSGRPSKFQTRKFQEWKKNDPHPERDNSSKHYRIIGKQYFNKTQIIPIGSIERFHRILPKRNNRRFRRFAFKLEKYLPNFINLWLARSQVVIYKLKK